MVRDNDAVGRRIVDKLKVEQPLNIFVHGVSGAGYLLKAEGTLC
jgi:hypothetical protein